MLIIVPLDPKVQIRFFEIFKINSKTLRSTTRAIYHKFKRNEISCEKIKKLTNILIFEPLDLRVQILNYLEILKTTLKALEAL